MGASLVGLGNDSASSRATTFQIAESDGSHCNVGGCRRPRGGGGGGRRLGKSWDFVVKRKWRGEDWKRSGGREKAQAWSSKLISPRVRSAIDQSLQNQEPTPGPGTGTERKTREDTIAVLPRIISGRTRDGSRKSKWGAVQTNRLAELRGPKDARLGIARLPYGGTRPRLLLFRSPHLSPKCNY